MTPGWLDSAGVKRSRVNSAGGFLLVWAMIALTPSA
jgi:hypothetical protein